MRHPAGQQPLRRRDLLAAVGTGAIGATSGCTGQLRSMTGWRSADPVSLDIKTLPVDADPTAMRISQLVADWFGDAGIDTTVTPMSEQELLRQVLLNHDFELVVFRAPPRFRTPDALYSLLHTQFAPAPGWQNPFGYGNFEVDELLETQRRTSGTLRADVVAQLQRTIARTNPLTVIGFPDEIRAARDDRFTNWRNIDLGSSTGYLQLDRADGGGASNEAGVDSSPFELRVVVTDRRPTENLNPIAVEFRGAGIFTGLLYDSLGYLTDDAEVAPWLASSWSISESDGRPMARVILRPDLSWHDGEPVSAGDVAFTYRFLADTTLDASDTSENDPVPAPSYQGRSTLVSSVEVVDDRTIDVRFNECDPAVARRAFTAPVLPEHVWADRTSTLSLAGIELGTATEALVTDNIPPVGSGPLAFVEHEPRESLVLERFEDHFLARNDASTPTGFSGGLAFDRLTLEAVGPDSTAVEVVADGEADVTGTSVGPRTVPRIGRAAELDLLVDRSRSFYFVGYNVRRRPLTNPRFRNALAHLVDKEFVAAEVFDGYARPAASILDGTPWIPTDLDWNGADPVTPFHGTDGDLDVEAAREELRDAGYRYEDDRLIEA